MNKTLRKTAKYVAIAGAVALLVYLVAWEILAVVVGVYLLLGILDVSRNDIRGQSPVLKRYFTGNGLLTWLLAPFNLAMDLLCKRTKGVLTLADLPPDCRAEVETVIATAERERAQIVRRMESSLGQGQRVMLVYKWYGRQVDSSLPEFNTDFKYVKTIAVSVFNPDTSTKKHYGPLRVTYRMLYNLTPVDRDDVFIEVGRCKHVWRDEPLFIFDDTLMHRSVNLSDQSRYCMFVDLMRPSGFLAFNTWILKAIGRVLGGVNRLFYKNWHFVG